MIEDPYPLILLILIFLFCSAFFSAAETSFSSLNRTRLRAIAEKGNKRAQKTLDLADRYDKLLTTILVGNNIVNIAMASVGTVLFVRLLPNVGAVVSTIVITVAVLIFGEISPKSLARERPERFAMMVTPVMRVLVWILTPINFLFTKWQAMLRRVFKLGDRQAMTQDELLMFVAELDQEGSIDAEEGDLLRSAIAFDGQEAQDILTPRVDMDAVSLQASKEEVAAIFSETQYSRLPVYDGSVDHIVGILYQKDFYTGSGISPKSVEELMKEPIFVPASMKLDDLLRILQRNKSHIVVVSDEFGGTMGIVTMEDVLEELVGEIWDEHDEEVELFRQTGENTYEIDCSADMDQLERFLDREIQAESATISGWVMEQLGCIPTEGDFFRYEDLSITVTSTDSHRVLKIRVQQDVSETEEEFTEGSA